MGDGFSRGPLPWMGGEAQPATDDTGWRCVEKDPPPKDGTQIWIAVAGEEYEAGWAYWSERYGNWFIPMTNRAYQMEPTHWQHVPIPPPQEPNTP